MDKDNRNKFIFNLKVFHINPLDHDKSTSKYRNRRNLKVHNHNCQYTADSTKNDGNKVYFYYNNVLRALSVFEPFAANGLLLETDILCPNYKKKVVSLYLKKNRIASYNKIFIFFQAQDIFR